MVIFIGFGVDIEDEFPLIAQALDDFFGGEEVGGFGWRRQDTTVFVSGGIGSERLRDLFEVEGFEDALDSFAGFGGDSDGEYLVFVNKEVGEGVVAHGAEAAEAVFKKEGAEAAYAFDEAVEADEFVCDVGVNLAVGIVPHDVEDGVNPGWEDGEQGSDEGSEAFGSDDDVEYVAIGPFFPLGGFVASIGGFELDEISRARGERLDGVYAEGKFEAPDFDPGNGTVGETTGHGSKGTSRGGLLLRMEGERDRLEFGVR